jgi:hypothetical protein
MLGTILVVPHGVTAAETFVIGDRVEWNLGGILFKGIVYNTRDGQYQIEREGYGRTTDWVNAADLRLLEAAAAAPPKPAEAPAPVRPAPAPPQPQPQPQPAPAAAAAFKIGDRVIWTLGGIPFEGTVFNAEGGRFQVERDGFGRTTDWINPTDLRLLQPAMAAAAVPQPQPLPNIPAAPPAAAPPAAQPQPQPAPVAAAAFKIGDRVIWTLGGIPFEGRIFNAEGGRFQVERDGFGRTADWINAGDLRPLNERPGPAAGQAPPNPAGVPLPGPGAPAPAIYKIGNRVEWEIGGIWFPGVVYNEEVGNYQVNRDFYGRAREWIAATNLRLFVPRRAETLVVGFEATLPPFKRGERVEVNIKGIWYRGNIGVADIDIDRYVIDRDNVQGDELVTGAQIRRLVYAPN